MGTLLARSLWLLVATMLMVLGPLLADPARASSCACRDVNNDGVCDGADIAIADGEWLAGQAFSDPAHTFLIPPGCSYTITTAPSGGIRVNANRIVVYGRIVSTPVGGEGILLSANLDIVMGPGATISSGGANKLSTSAAANVAVGKASVGLKAGSTCTLEGALLVGNPTTGAGLVGIQCAGDIVLRGTEILGAGVDVQSLTGKIDGSAAAASGKLSLLRCDDPAQNPNGNNNGTVDDGDFPCTVVLPAPFVWSGQLAVNGFCAAPSALRAFNNPLVVISGGLLDLGSPQAPGTEVEGRYLVNLFAENGNVDTQNATVTNGAAATGGAKISVYADPTSVARLAVLKETATNPSAGSINVDGACYSSLSAVSFNGTLVGTPNPTGCTAGGPTGLLAGIGLLCDDPALNPNGNNNGVVDAGDFPCVITFPGPAAAAIALAEEFCGGEPVKADVEIAKEASPDPVVAGGVLTYTLAVTNVGSVAALGVGVSDPLPAGTTFESCVTSQGTCTNTGGTVAAAIGSLDPGASATIVLKVKAPAGAACAVIDNTATVSAVNDGNPANNTASTSTACVAPPDVEIKKEDSPDPVVGGTTLTYTITVKNIGGVVANDVKVTDPLPTGTTFESCVASQGSCALSASTVTATIGSLDPGASATITLKIKAPTGSACKTINNEATVSATGDANPANNTASTSTACALPPDVEVKKSDSPDPVLAGETLTYTITVKNLGGTVANDVKMTDVLPAGTTFESCVSSQGSCAQSAGTVTATIGSLNAGASATVTLKVKAPTGAACAVVNNEAKVSATGDTNPANDKATTSTTCKLPPPPDVEVKKSDSPDPVTGGTTLTYTITVTNVGGTVASDVKVTDPLPDGTTFESCVASQGSCAQSASTVTATIGSLAPGASATITLKVKAPTGDTCKYKKIYNEAKVSATGDTNASNDKAYTYTTCTPPTPPDVEVKKSDSPDPVTEGGTLTYTITVKNVGGIVANDVKMTDPLPYGTTFESCISSQGSCAQSAGTVTATIGSLAPAASAIITLKVKAPTGWTCKEKKIYNEAKVSATGDTNTSNDKAYTYTTCTIPSPPDVKISKTDSPDPVKSGATLTYIITVQNIGGSVANDVKVTDPLPSGTTFESCVASQGSCTLSAGTVTATIGSLNAGASATATLKVKAPTGDTCKYKKIYNEAKVTATGETNTSNNKAYTYTACSW